MQCPQPLTPQIRFAATVNGNFAGASPRTRRSAASSIQGLGEQDGDRVPGQDDEVLAWEAEKVTQAMIAVYFNPVPGDEGRHRWAGGGVHHQRAVPS